MNELSKLFLKTVSWLKKWESIEIKRYTSHMFSRSLLPQVNNLIDKLSTFLQEFPDYKHELEHNISEMKTTEEYIFYIKKIAGDDKPVTLNRAHEGKNQRDKSKGTKKALHKVPDPVLQVH